MKLIHLSDLHLGKRLNEFPLIDEQKDILSKVLKIIDEEKVDGVIIAGDIFDKSVASGEAISLFDDFLSSLLSRKLKVYAISGNHDSAERIAYGGRVMEQSNIFMSPIFDGETKKVEVSDDFGSVNIYLLPYLRPNIVRRFYPEEEISSYTDALKLVIDNMHVNTSERNILVCHQFVTGAELSESEDIMVGGVDNVSAEVFKDFDYVALGHIHKAQNITKSIRYPGTLLKYSFSEAKSNKTVTIIELKNKGELSIKEIDIKPLRDLREIKGKYDELVSKKFYEGTDTTDYLHITLTDEEEIFDVLNKLRVVYPNIMKLDYDNKRTRENKVLKLSDEQIKKPPIELFGDLYSKQNNEELSDTQKEYLDKLIESIWR